MKIVLEIIDMYKSFGGIRAIDGCSFDVRGGEITGLIGPNGAGKTTVFNLITGFYKPDTGHVKFHGKKITHLKPHQRARLGIARTFQAIRLFPKMKVIDNILLASSKVNEGLQAAIFNKDLVLKRQHKDLGLAMNLLADIGLTDKADSLVEELSYGQKKLVEIVRALVAQPTLLLLDEPASGVNPVTLNKILKLVSDFKNDGGTVLLIEHNMKVVMKFCDSVIVLDYGKKLVHGLPREVQDDPRVIEAYLGKQREDIKK